METAQTAFWSGNFGQQYTDRNPQSVEELNDLYQKNFSTSRTTMNLKFLGNLPRDIRILEVGCNIGMQLQVLQQAGFNNLYGVELQPYAVEKAKQLSRNINIIQGSGFDLPFKDKYFDLVYTSGVLIHISPDDLPVIMKEMVRCSKHYIWGFEYYSEQVQSIPYRGNEGFLWKADYCRVFLDHFSELRVVNRKKYPYISAGEKENFDEMYLLQKV